MSTETKEPPAIPKRLAAYLTKRAEELDRAIEDTPTFQCFALYCLALLDKLDVRRHWLRENVFLPGKDLPNTANQEEQLLQRFADTVRERHPRFYAVYAENLPGQLRRLCWEWLRQYAEYEESQALLDNAVKAIPHQLTRPWDNPVRFNTDPVTGARSLDVPYPAATPSHFLEAQAFLKELDPARPVRKPGRPKGSSKPASSGRKPSVDQDVYKEAWEAKQGTRKYQAIPWWRTFARKKDIPIPETRKEEEALRKKLEEWALKGKTLDRKKVGS